MPLPHASRRSFLQTASVAAAAASVAPYTAFGAARAGKGPNETIRVAVLGLRNRGSGSHIANYLKINEQGGNVEVAAVVDPDAELLAKLGVEKVESKTGKKPDAYADYRKLLEDDSIDVVSVASPNHWHALQSVHAIQAGKDVYVEKPVSHNVIEGRRIVQAARKHNRLCQYGAQCRTMQGTREMVEAVLAGEIGEVKLARGLCYKRRKDIGKQDSPLQFPSQLDRNLWVGPAADEPIYRPERSSAGIYNPHYDWHWDFNTGNGDLGNQGIHQMDVARWGLGVDGLGDSVSSYGGRLGYEDAGNTPNTQVSVHQYGDKRIIFETRGLEIHGPDGQKRGNRIGVVFYGTEGTAIQWGYNSSSILDPDGKLVRNIKGGSDQDHYENFLNAVRSGDRSTLSADIEDGHLSSALCHLGNISYLMGNKAPLEEIAAAQGDATERETLKDTVQHLEYNNVDLSATPLTLGPTLSLAGENFTGDRADEANGMLIREYREPFVLPTEAEL
ncbi:Gfo/Idh/MocA family protein [Alienimonas chondri]|uniref:Inositol 2-dehydrogenase/D-chiro-inositol 3-dehydrogenase n=1 Tax=Alienimonas chondri TaxID=2681879 RepID=A0ABX1VEJ6_9PLAN|nr:Gfo/Idh/MocA family oxidoreductase [Alienimonas chondri]NNJ25851.1 Inositol 2-dehydrogenase/D-chiro-inositol 3-dehydrogenase [Alienimonas chondri]